MTQELFREDSYLKQCTARVSAVTEQGVLLDRTVFYPTGGGQAGDSGVLILADGSEIAIFDTRKHKDATGLLSGDILHVTSSATANPDCWPQSRLKQGDAVTARIDWERRFRRMRFHTTTHLLCKLVPQLVDGCSITDEYARLDFSMTEPLDKDALTSGIAALVQAACPVVAGFISDDELDANPALVKSMRVRPPRGSGRIRTIRIGHQELIDCQPCGGTHVANTSEIGKVVVTKLEKKGATTRRVVLGFA